LRGEETLMNAPHEARSRQFIAALQVSLDGYVAGPEGELDWVDSWADSLALVGPVDAFVLGRGMFDNGYEAYWDAALADPKTASEMYGREPYLREVDYAQLARATPHIVLSKTMTQAAWPNVRIARDVAEVSALKDQPGQSVYVVGGPGLVATLMNAGLIDELRLMVHPLILGGGTALFDGIEQRRMLELAAAKPRDGRVNLSYRVQAG
jgi:dihydrofolate reductase